LSCKIARFTRIKPSLHNYKGLWLETNKSDWELGTLSCSPPAQLHAANIKVIGPEIVHGNDLFAKGETMRHKESLLAITPKPKREREHPTSSHIISYLLNSSTQTSSLSLPFNHY